jgi:hypothetical protein
MDGEGDFETAELAKEKEVKVSAVLLAIPSWKLLFVV